MAERTLHNELVRLQRDLSRSMAEYINATRRMIYLVKAVDLTLESLYSGRALERAIWRYEALWLPILAALSDPTSGSNQLDDRPAWKQPAFTTKVDDIRSKNFSKGGLWLSKDTVVPPIDIAWVWHCHRLNPVAYEADLKAFCAASSEHSDEPHKFTADYIKRACATDIETAFTFSDGEDSQSRPTRRLWDIVYPFESYMPKYLLSHSFAVEESKKRQHITSYTNEIVRTSFRSILQYDLMRACAIQKSFLYQIVDEDDPDRGEVYETNKYLQRAYQRYLQFIILHGYAPDVLLVPMNDINIIWHMHLSCTAEYAHDCAVLNNGRLVLHDPIHVDDMRIEAIQQEEQLDVNVDDIDPSIMEETEFKKIQEKKRRGIAIRETKAIWESIYGSQPRYDLPDTVYRGQPPGERGGFYPIFVRFNGTAKDITWPETILYMILAVAVFCAGGFATVWAFYKTLVDHGKFLLGIPAGVGVMGLGIYIFLCIPTSRPLSSQSRFWLERAYRQTHNPLPPYLISTDKKLV